MPTISSLVFSNHAQYERADRIALIDNVIGWGQIIKEAYYQGAYHYVTDTGVVLVVGDNRKTIMTLYLLTPKHMNITFKGNVPSHLTKKVAYYARMGWSYNY